MSGIALPHAAYIRWAKERFAEEIGSDFNRACTFDGVGSACFLKAIRLQPQEALMVLKEILPLGVAFGYPGSIKERDRLPSRERSALERYLETLSQVERESGHVSEPHRFATWGTKEFRSELKEARRTVNVLTKDFAKQWACSAERGAPGEWGFVRRASWGQMVLSLFLMYNMELTYLLKVWDHAGVLLSPENHYLGALGIGRSDWLVPDVERCRNKALIAAEFIRWHIDEWVDLAKRIQNPVSAGSAKAGTPAVDRRANQSRS